MLTALPSLNSYVVNLLLAKFHQHPISIENVPNKQTWVRNVNIGFNIYNISIYL